MKGTLGHTSGRWIKKNLFSSKTSTCLTIIFLCLFAKGLGLIVNWLFIESVWWGTAKECRQASGACWPFIFEKARFIIFGLYPDDQLWRPITATVLFLALIFYSRERQRWGVALLRYWGVGIIAMGVLMRGNAFGLPLVETTKWGGLPLTILLAFVGFVTSYPIGILLALARRSEMLVLKWISIAYIELIRGVPLISLLFVSSVMFPLFLPEGITINKVLRAQGAIIIFFSAYMAEVVRGGLAAVDSGQYESADALALNYYQKMRLIILPQALKVVIPPTVNTTMGMFKDTSLVMIIGLFDLLLTSKTALTDSAWQGHSLEAYFFVGAIYFIFCYSMAKYSRRLETELSRGHN